MSTENTNFYTVVTPLINEVSRKFWYRAPVVKSGQEYRVKTEGGLECKGIRTREIPNGLCMRAINVLVYHQRVRVLTAHLVQNSVTTEALSHHE